MILILTRENKTLKHKLTNLKQFKMIKENIHKEIRNIYIENQKNQTICCHDRYYDFRQRRLANIK